MSILELSCFGFLKVRRAGEVVAGFESSRVRALLAYLAVEVERPHTRDELATLLWPDMPGRVGLDNLRQALANLRRVLGDRSAAPTYLLVSRETIQFNSAAPYRLDVAQFRALLAHCRMHPHRQPAHCAACARRLQEAVALYLGDFLANFFLPDSDLFEEWAQFKRERLQQQMIGALERLVLYFERLGDYDSARNYAHRLVELEPWHEDAHYRLMCLYSLSGQPDSALAQYRICKRILAEELGAAPTPEMTRLYERISARDETLITELRPASPRHNIPEPVDRFIGRQVLRAQLGDLLAAPGCRLLTLTGVGGIGKTRLAIQVTAEQAHSFADGAAFVDLASVSDPLLIPPAIARALEIEQDADGPVIEQVKAQLRNRELLLVLDNFEHLLPGAPLVNELLSAIPKLQILVTSRTVLNLPGEHQVVVPPLSVPVINGHGTIDSVRISEAVQLFVQRAQARQPAFQLSDENAEATVAICARLEGLPLAIELAAARSNLLPPHALLARLDSRLQLLTGGGQALPARQQTLRATLDWSYNLLDSAEQRLFRQCGLFVGGCTLEAAEAVCDPGPELDILAGIGSLVDKSLLRASSMAGEEPRFTMLETVREYALEKLAAAGEGEAARERHLDYFLGLAERFEAHVMGPDEAPWLERLLSDANNLRAASGWAAAQTKGEKSARLATLLERFWDEYGDWMEGWRWLTCALSQRAGRGGALWANTLTSAGGQACTFGSLKDGIRLLEEAVGLWREVGDKQALAGATILLGDAMGKQGDAARGEALLEDGLALACEIGATNEIAFANYLLGGAAIARSDEARAVALFAKAREVYRERGNKGGESMVLGRLSHIAIGRGDLRAARVLLEENLVLLRESGMWYVAISRRMGVLGTVATAESNWKEARQLFEEALSLEREYGNKKAMAWQLGYLGYIVNQQGDHARSAAYYRETLISLEEHGEELWTAWCLAGLAALFVKVGHIEPAARLAAWAGRRVDSPHDEDLSSLHKGIYERNVATVREGVHGTSLEVAWAEGEAMTLAEVLGEALALAAQVSRSEQITPTSSGLATIPEGASSTGG